jgi:hypothetical protein
LTSANVRDMLAIEPVMRTSAPIPKYFARSVGHSARIFRLAPDSQIKIASLLLSPRCFVWWQ